VYFIGDFFTDKHDACNRTRAILSSPPIFSSEPMNGFSGMIVYFESIIPYYAKTYSASAVKIS